MKANEFVKKFGIDHTVYLLEDTELDEFAIYSNCAGKSHIDTVSVSDLKRLVESWELVNEFDDIEQARSWIPDMDDEMPYQVRGSDKRFFKGQLIKAIADVESCQ